VTEQVIAITRCISWVLMPQKCISSRGSAPGPRCRSLQHSPRPPSWIWWDHFACLCL